jgi:hypothetical protein
MKLPPFLMALIAGVILTATDARADGPTIPDATFAPSRYETLWTKSPFAVATAETVGDTSPDYYLVGIAVIDGVSYASVIERQNQEHFLISTDKPSRGLTLTSINRSRDGTNTYAVVQKDGQSMTLKLEQAPAAVASVPGAPPMNPMGMPGTMTPQIQMPGTQGFPNQASNRPFIRFHRPAIHLPPQPGQQMQNSPVPPPPTPPQ